MAKKRFGRVTGIDVRDYDTAHHRSGGLLKIPKTPVERIMLDAKLKKMKRDFMRKHGS